MFNITFPYKLGQTVYYITRPERLTKDEIVVQGVIQGYQIRKTKTGYTLGVDLGKRNNVPIEKVSESREYLKSILNKSVYVPTSESFIRTIK